MTVSVPRVWLVELETRWRGTSRRLIAVTTSVAVAMAAADKRHQHSTVDSGKWCEYCKTPWLESDPPGYFHKLYTDDDVSYDYSIHSVPVLSEASGIVLEEPEICICSAVVASDGRIFRGHRHHNCLGVLADMNLKLKQGHSNETQGFITSKNRYVTRREAFQLQKAAGIESVDPKGYRGEELYSEDLY